MSRYRPARKARPARGSRTGVGYALPNAPKRPCVPVEKHHDDPLSQALKSAVFTVYASFTPAVLSVMQARDKAARAQGKRDPALALWEAQRSSSKAPPGCVEYGIFWQSPALSGDDVDDVVASVIDSVKEEGNINPLYALRSGLNAASGLRSLIGVKNTGAPFSLVATLLVDMNVLSRGPGYFPRAYTFNDGNLGIYVSSIPIKTGADELEFGKPDEPDGLLPTLLSQIETKRLSESLVQADWSRSGKRLIPLVVEGEAGKNIFSYEAISASESFRRSLERLKEKNPDIEFAEELNELRCEAYQKTLEFGIKGVARKSKAEEVIEGPAPTGVSVKTGDARVFGRFFGPESKTGSSYRDSVTGQMVEASGAPKKKSGGFGNVFTFAQGIVRTLPDAPLHVKGRKTEIPALTPRGQEKIEMAMRRLSTADDPISLPEDPSDLVGMRDALVKMRNRLKKEAIVDYHHQMSLGLLPDQLGAEGAHGHFAEEYLEELAKENGRRAGKKKVSISRVGRENPGARKNPLDEEALQVVLEYVNSSDKPDSVEYRELEERAAHVLKKLDRESPAADWEITENKVSTLFPKKGELKQWDPTTRLRSLGTYDFVSRVGTVKPSEEVIAAAAAGAVPFEDKQALEYLTAQAGLSLQEAVKIIELQKRARQSSRSIPASSVIGKMTRTKKLVGYVPPAEVMRVGNDSKILILMSPKGASPRVMTYRRNIHMDFDQTGTSEDQMMELLGRALQASLFWLAQRPVRQKTTVIYVGRIGDPYLYVAWAPGRPVALAEVTRGLAGAGKIELWKKESAAKRNELLSKDIQEYKAAAARMRKVEAPYMPSAAVVARPARPVEAPVDFTLPVPAPAESEPSIETSSVGPSFEEAAQQAGLITPPTKPPPEEVGNFEKPVRAPRAPRAPRPPRKSRLEAFLPSGEDDDAEK